MENSEGIDPVERRIVPDSTKKLQSAGPRVSPQAGFRASQAGRPTRPALNPS